MISDEQQKVLLRISDLKAGWCTDGTGNKFKPSIIRNTRFLLTMFNDPTIDITPMIDGKSIVLTIHRYINTTMLGLSADTKHILVNVYANKFTVDVLDSKDTLLYQVDYNMKKFVNTYILA